MALAFISGESKSITLVPLIKEFVNIDIDFHSIGVVSKLVKYIGVIMPVGEYSTRNLTCSKPRMKTKSMFTIMGGMSSIHGNSEGTLWSEVVHHILLLN